MDSTVAPVLITTGRAEPAFLRMKPRKNAKGRGKENKQTKKLASPMTALSSINSI